MENKETLEEAAERYFKKVSPNICFYDAVKFGAKWQMERSYSEEEVYEILAQFVNDAPTVTKKWFNKFKKK